MIGPSESIAPKNDRLLARPKTGLFRPVDGTRFYDPLDAPVSAAGARRRYSASRFGLRHRQHLRDVETDVGWSNRMARNVRTKSRRSRQLRHYRDSNRRLRISNCGSRRVPESYSIQSEVSLSQVHLIA